MSLSEEKVYLVDGSGFIFRAYYAIRPLSTRDGTPTNAVIGTARMLLKLIKDRSPHYLGIAFDSRENFRKNIYAEYKANREEPPEDLVPQFALIRELVEAMGIPVLYNPGYEADDIIATLAQKAHAAGHQVVVVSSDKDLMQLMQEGIALFDPMKDKDMSDADVIEKFGVPPNLVTQVQAMAGDTSDNIPGVPKVGVKTAAKLINTYGDIEAVYRGLQSVQKRKAAEQSVIDHIESARLSMRLVTLDSHVPVALDLDALRYSHPEEARLAPFLERIEASSLLRDLHRSNPVKPAPPNQQDLFQTQTTLPIPERNYKTILTINDLNTIIARIQKVGFVSVDLETTSLDTTEAHIVGFSLATTSDDACYIPTGHHDEKVPLHLSNEDVLHAMKPIFENPKIGKLGQNLKYDMMVLLNHGIQLAGIRDDSMLAAYVLDPTRASFSMDSLAHQALGYKTITYEDVTTRPEGKVGFDQVPVDEATAYAAEDADIALQLCQHFSAKLQGTPLDDVYRNIELPLIPVLAAMETKGIRVDLDALAALSVEFSGRMTEVEQRIVREVGHEINLASPKQLAELLFVELGYPALKKTKTGFSTDQEVLEQLAETYPLAGWIIEHRMLAKLCSTYVDSLPKMLNPRTGRVHTSYRQTGTATGRLSSSDPNLQNIPIRTEDGLRIRKAFVADEGYVLVSADYSQIELRILAHLCDDQSFRDAFINGEDIHRRTAQEILTGGAPPDAEARRRAKAINFGILYGLSEFGLAKQLHIGRAEASAYIQRYFARYPGIRTFLDKTIEEGRHAGFVSTISGRRRYLPDLNSRNMNVRRGAERIAMNTPLQGSAADLIKLAMIRVHQALSNLKLDAHLLLQVHDELVVECPVEHTETVQALLRDHMCHVMRLHVPLVVDVGHGRTWAEAH